MEKDAYVTTAGSCWSVPSAPTYMRVTCILSTRSVVNPTCAYLCVPLRVNSVTGHPGALLLPMVWQRGEDAVFPRLDGQLKVGVRIEEHPFL